MPNKQPEKEFCLYTSSSFHDGLGTSLITEPHIAASLVDAIDDPGIEWQWRTHPNGSRFDARAEPPFEVRDLPGKGKGVVATRDIEAGEVLMVDFVAFLGNLDFFRAMSIGDTRKLFLQAFDQLPDQSRIMSLARSSGGMVLDDILRTNGFGIRLDRVQHLALLPGISVSRTPTSSTCTLEES